MRYRPHKRSRKSQNIRRNPRFEITSGELIGSFEPYDLPGAFVLQWYKVIDPTGGTPSEKINWSGSGHWMEYYEGAPQGYAALWLGPESAARPIVVFVKNQPTKESDEYYKGYRKGFTAKRRPTITDKMSQPMIEGVQQGWRDAQNRR